MHRSIGAEQADTGMLVWKGPLASAGTLGSVLFLCRRVLSWH